MRKFTVIAAVALLMATASSCGPIKAPEITEASVFETQSSQNENNVKDLIARQELPKLTRSLDFENVKRRLEYLNQSNTVGYIYLLSSNGQLVREGQVAGKVTSLNTFITPMEEIRKIENGYYYGESKYPATYGIVQAPDLDGTYGENVSGVFWFTPDGVYQEWIGPYLFSSERMTFTSEPVLVEARGSK